MQFCVKLFMDYEFYKVFFFSKTFETIRDPETASNNNAAPPQHFFLVFQNQELARSDTVRFKILLR